MKYIFEVTIKPGYRAEDYAEAWVHASELIQRAPGARGQEGPRARGLGARAAQVVGGRAARAAGHAERSAGRNTSRTQPVARLLSAACGRGTRLWAHGLRIMSC